MHLELTFSDDCDLNEVIKREWRSLACEEILVSIPLGTVLDYFELDDDIASHLHLWCKRGNKWVEVASSKTWKDVKEMDSQMLQVFCKAGTKCMFDTTCDSDFMQLHMLQIGKSIRKNTLGSG